MTDIYLAGADTYPGLFDEIGPPFLLTSFVELNDWHLNYRESSACESFMLDSGAFTFMKKQTSATSGTARNNTDYSNVDWTKYATRYIDTINEHDIGHFFELDIDSVVGLPRVRELRKRLERETGKQPIPVWHRSRGRETFLDLCDEYPYVALGGIVAGEIKPSEFQYFPWFINQAHERDAKLHALGFSPLRKDNQYRFDSVDSTSWLTNGSRFGHSVMFDGTELVQHSSKKREGRCVKQTELARHNLCEWKRYVRYRSDKYA